MNWFTIVVIAVVVLALLVGIFGGRKGAVRKARSGRERDHGEGLYRGGHDSSGPQSGGWFGGGV